MPEDDRMTEWDIIVVGAGTTGLMTAIFASRQGARVLVLEVAEEIGGTLHVSSGRMSAAGTKFQAANGIEDTPDEHYDDVMRICRNTADPELVRLAVDLAPEMFDWLTDHGMPLATPAPVLGAGSHEPYRKARYAWGVEYGRSILKTIAPHFWAQIASGRVTLKLRTRVESLIQDANSRAVTGVRVRGPDDKPAEYSAARIVIATGGFGGNPEMMEETYKTPLYSIGARRTSRGDGLKMALAAGAAMRGAEYYHGSFGSILASYDYPSSIIATAETMPQTRPPWEIYVDSDGNRFINECEPSIDAREHALIALPDRRYWIVFDESIFRDAPSIIPAWRPEEIRDAFGNHPMFQTADSLDELAQRTGMNPAALTATVAAYNGALNGDDPFGRDHRPRPITQGPFYAIRQHCTVIVTTAGVVVDHDLRVVNDEGEPIPNLFAAGEVLGSVATMGGSAANGMLVTPALAFGRLLGEKILAPR
jgi:fumarate reductase flavoprotein subunit